MDKTNAKPKGISVVIDFRMWKSSGIGTYIRNIAPYAADKFDVTLLGNKDELASLPWADKVKVIDARSKIYGVAEQLELARKIPRCDVFWSPHYNVPLLPVAAKKRMVTVHDVYHLAHSEEFSPMQRLYAKIVMRSAVSLSDAVLTVSEFSRHEIIKYCKVHPSKIAVTYNAVCGKMFKTDTDGRVKSKYSLPDDYILFVGNVKPNKNLKNLLLALDILKDARLVVVGKKDGFINNDSAVSEILSQNPGLAGRVHFTGYVDDGDMASLYSNASVFVFPSLYEGFGIPPLEAQSCLCPVISSGEASLREVCAESVIYCDPFSPADISDKIVQVKNSREIRRELIEKGQANIKRFSWEKSANITVSVIQSICS